MKTTVINSIILDRLAILLGIGSLPLAAEPQAVPPAFENLPENDVESHSFDPFASHDPDSALPRMVQVQVEFIELPHETLTKLLFLRSPKKADATELRKQVQELVSKNEASVPETQILVCKPGQKSTTESIHEFIYPTEYVPMTLPQTSKTSDEPMDIIDAICFSPATPTAFDARNLGSTLEVEATNSGDNRIMELRLIPEFVWHTGNTVWHEGKDLGGNPFKISMPFFYCVRMNTSITCIDGQYNFVGSLSPKDSKGVTDTTRKLMVFVKCDVLTVK